MSMEMLYALFAGLPRQGPGDDEATLRALDAVTVPANPRVLDVGCGTGAVTNVLEARLRGLIVATDLFPAFVGRAAWGRVRGVCSSMDALPFREGAFDLIWSEGAIYIMGFEAGLQAWRPLLRDGGHVVVSELSWLGDARPAEAAAFWKEAYPGMADVAGNRARAERAGYRVVDSFTLPSEAWWPSIYTPLRARLPRFLERYAGNLEAEAVAADTAREIALFERFNEYYGYQFYVLRKG